MISALDLFTGGRASTHVRVDTNSTVFGPGVLWNALLSTIGSVTFTRIPRKSVSFLDECSF